MSKHIRKHYYPLEKDNFYLLQNQLRAGMGSPFARACWFYVVNRASFSGSTLSGGMGSGDRFTERQLDKLATYKLPENVEIRKADSLTWLRRRTSKFGAARAFIFEDPAYLLSNSKLYGDKGNRHEGFNHQILSVIQTLFGTQRILVVDLETASPVDLKKHGFANYRDHPDTRVLMTGVEWLHEPGKPRVFDHETDQAALPPDVLWALNAPPGECLLAAANCEFDRRGLERMGYPTPPEKWIDVLVVAYILAFSGRLADVLKQVPLDIAKHERGAQCISTFSVGLKPWQEHPDLWDDFCTYCAGDADVEAQLLRWCITQLSDPRLHETVRTVMRQELIYRRINPRGIPVDLEAVAGAQAIIRDETDRIMERLRELTGLANPNSRDQLLDWCAREGDPLPDLQKATVRDKLLDPGMPEVQREVLELRQALAKTSAKKFAALARVTSPDGRLRNGWQFYGASRTGRVAGRTLNPANLARPGDRSSRACGGDHRHRLAGPAGGDVPREVGARHLVLLHPRLAEGARGEAVVRG